MIDPEVYLSQLIPATYDELGLDQPWIAPDFDINLLERLPAFTWNIIGDGQIVDGPGLWTFTFNANFFGDGMDEAKATARAGYDVIHAWDDNPLGTRTTLDGIVMAIAGVEDIDLPSRLPAAEVDGRHLVQYAGSFSLAMRGI